MKTTIPKNTFVSCILIVIGCTATFLAPGQDVNRTNSPESAVAPFERQFHAFVNLASQDHALGALLARHTLTMHCIVPDLRVQWFIGFHDGKTLAGIGSPPYESELIFLADSKNLDQLLRGIPKVQVQTIVHLSTWKQLMLKKALPQIREELARIYASACLQTGPTDLAQNETSPASGVK